MTQAPTSPIRHSLTTRVIAGVVGVVMLSVVLSGAFAYRELHTLAMELSNRTLSGKANDLAEDLQGHISSFLINAQRLSKNDLFVNALADDKGREIYLNRFLGGLSALDGFAASIELTDFEGKTIARNSSEISIQIPREKIEEVVDREVRSVRLETQNGFPYLIVIEPVIYGNTGRAEGALVVKIRLSEWLDFEKAARALREADWLSSLSLAWQDFEGRRHTAYRGQKPGSGPSKSVPIEVPSLGASIPINVSLESQPEFFDTSNRALLVNVATIGLGLIIAATLLAAYIVKKLTRRLVRLKEEAGYLTEGKNKEVVFTVDGDDEITDLSKAFNSLVSDLREAYRKLESKAEQSIKEREERFRSIVQNSTEGILTIDLEGRIEMANPAANAIFGYGPGELIGNKVEILLPERFRKNHALYIQESDLHAPRIISRSRDLYGLRKDGSEFFLELTVSPIEIDGERKFLGMTRDVSERKKSEEALQQAKEQADTANKAKSQFLSSMSHELRTPLNAILGFGQLLNDPELKLGAEQENAVNHILNSGDHLLNLINEVLDLAKIESGNMDMSIEAVSVSSIIAPSVTMAEALGQRYGIKVHYDAEGQEPLAVKADLTRTKQVLINLLSNAVKYNRTGGSVTLDCASDGGDWVRFSVTDTGPGISKEDQKELFKPFSQLASRDKTVEGTGIGLTITKQLVELMRGQIGLESAVGEGSTFWFEVPNAKADAAELIKEEANVKSSDFDIDDVLTEPKSVVYVEDNPANVDLMRLIISKVPLLTLEVYETAEDALPDIEAQPPDLVLMDVNLPGMSGIEATRVLKFHAKTKDIPVIGVSANAMIGDVVRARSEGFERYVTKPFKIEEVFNAIAAVLGAPGLVAADGATDQAKERETSEEKLKENGAYSDGDLPVLSANAIATIQRSRDQLGDAYMDVVRNMFRIIPELSQELHDALDAGDAELVERTAHRLKTNSATLGAVELSAWAQTVESLASEGNLDEVRALLAQYKAEYDRVAPAIAKLIST